MPARLILFSCGVILTSLLPQLPPLVLGWLLIPLWLASVYVGALDSCVWWRFARFLQVLAFFLLGCLWGIYCGHELLRTQLGDTHNVREFIVAGYVDDLPHWGRLKRHKIH